ncbi:MAG TPA: GtrA family protein [Bryobacteraceae bacterium]|nr:GtrA family protein [Bryobacteraceae bacterium]
MSTVLLIPAYRPGPELVEVLDAIPAGVFAAVVIVDDGSGAGYRERFAACRATVLRHDRNRGKGAALRTGMAHILSAYPGCGVVTADADGQHHPGDIVRVAERSAREPEALVLGARSFNGAVPGRSRIGNRMARLIFRMLMGQKLQDTQTGLRGIPPRLVCALPPITSTGYEFEIDMLTAAKHLAVPIVEEPVRTIYRRGNPSSHFHPLADSMRIGFVLARFTMLSLATAVLDNFIFSLAIRGGFQAAGAQATARAIAVLVNYPLARRAVFLSREPHRSTLVRYLALVTASGFLSYKLLTLVERWLSVDVLTAKILAEMALFLVNFLIQRDWVFVRQDDRAATDWDGYYRSPTPAARWTRRYTAAVLVACLRKFGGNIEQLIEFGGANSCFLEKIRKDLAPREYHVIDTNAYGLALLGGRGVNAHQQDCRAPALDLEADAVFSVGLIEHFDADDTRQAIASHFALLKPGGCAVLSFPTPTWLYRAARAIAEALGAWKFPDERPLDRAEVTAAASPFATLEFEKILWPIVFTQRLMVFRKRA